MGASPDSPVDATSFLDRTFNLRKRWASMGINPGLAGSFRGWLAGVGLGDSRARIPWPTRYPARR
jgi:hypothetical protein